MGLLESYLQYCEMLNPKTLILYVCIDEMLDQNLSIYEHYYKKYLPRRAKSINRGSFCNRLGDTVTVNNGISRGGFHARLG